MYQRILVAVDDSMTSQLALKEAALLAKDQRAMLRLAHVIDDTYAYTSLETPRQMADRQTALQAAGEAVLTRAAAAAHSLGVTAETTLLEIIEAGKHVYDSVEQEAERWAADLIVIGTHGRRGFRRLLLGSVAEGLIRMTTKPVLLVRGE